MVVTKQLMQFIRALINSEGKQVAGNSTTVSAGGLAAHRGMRVEYGEET